MDGTVCDATIRLSTSPPMISKKKRSRARVSYSSSEPVLRGGERVSRGVYVGEVVCAKWEVIISLPTDTRQKTRVSSALLDLGGPAFDAFALATDGNVQLVVGHAFRILHEFVVCHSARVRTVGRHQLQHGQ